MKDVLTNSDGRDVHHIVLAEEVSFFNKASIIKSLKDIPENSHVIIDCSASKAIAYDVVEFIYHYPLQAELKNITVEMINFIPPKIIMVSH